MPFAVLSSTLYEVSWWFSERVLVLTCPLSSFPGLSFLSSITPPKPPVPLFVESPPSSEVEQGMSIPVIGSSESEIFVFQGHGLLASLMSFVTWNGYIRASVNMNILGF